MKIDVGGGHCPKSGHLNVDRTDAADVHVDLAEVGRSRVRLPFGDGEVDEVYSSHFLEHIDPFHGVLAEIARVSRLGARVEIRVPHWGQEMAMCAGHKHVVSENVVASWETSPEDWFPGTDKRLRLVETKYAETRHFAEAKTLFPSLTREQLFRFILNTCHEIQFVFEVVQKDGVPEDIAPKLPQALTIITATWQRPRQLVNVIRQVQGQTVTKGVEHIVVSDGPDPEAREICQHFGVKYLECEQHHGDWGAHAKDLGVEAASGEHVCFWDDDNFYEPFAVEIITKTIGGYSDVVITSAWNRAPGTGRFWLIPEHWSGTPVLGNIDSICLTVRRSLAGTVKMASFREYAYDFAWINAILATEPSVTFNAAAMGMHL